MKDGIHPESKKVNIRCACGSVVETFSTMKKDYTVEICSACHPFFTGKQKLIDSAGKVEKFQRKYANFKSKKSTTEEKQ